MFAVVLCFYGLCSLPPPSFPFLFFLSFSLVFTSCVHHATSCLVCSRHACQAFLSLCLAANKANKAKLLIAAAKQKHCHGMGIAERLFDVFEPFLGP